jgi:hypothetical protein
MSNLSELSKKLYVLEGEFIELLISLRTVRDDIKKLEEPAKIKMREIVFDDPLGLNIIKRPTSK